MSTFKFIKKIKIIALIALLASLNACGGKTNRDDDAPLEGSAPTHGRPNTGGNSGGSGGGSGLSGSSGSGSNSSSGRSASSSSGTSATSGSGSAQTEQERLAAETKARNDAKLAKVKNIVETAKFKDSLANNRSSGGFDKEIDEILKKLGASEPEAIRLDFALRTAKSSVGTYQDLKNIHGKLYGTSGKPSVMPRSKASYEKALADIVAKETYTTSPTGMAEIKAYKDAKAASEQIYEENIKKYNQELIKIISDSKNVIIMDDGGRLTYGVPPYEGGHVDKLFSSDKHGVVRKYETMNSLFTSLKDKTHKALFEEAKKLREKADEAKNNFKNLAKKATNENLFYLYGDGTYADDAGKWSLVDVADKVDVENKIEAIEKLERQYLDLLDKFMEKIIADAAS